MTIVGTRPELIKMSRVIEQFDKFTHHILVHTGQNYDYELNQVFFEDLNIREPDYFLNTASDASIKTIAKILEKIDDVLDEVNPDAVMLYGDTNSCLSVIAVKKRKIPIFHMEAGNRCFDQRVPEEINRKIIDHLSDINLVLSEHARRYLIKEGIKPDTIIKTGTHMYEVLNYYFPKIIKSNILERLELIKKKFFLISIHREENTDNINKLEKLILLLNAIAKRYKYPVIVSTHPRTKSMLKEINNITLDNKVQLLEPFGFTNYIKLQLNAACIISDSGTITEEAMILNLPAITIRDSHERPEGNDYGALIMSTISKENVINNIEFILKQNLVCNQDVESVTLNEQFKVSNKIFKIVSGYIDYINRNVWHK
mgnify:FL=1